MPRTRTMQPPRDEQAERRQQDLELVRRLLSGDKTAEGEWVERMRCVPAMVAAIHRRIGRNRLSRDDLAEVAQDALVRIWQKLPTFEGRATLPTWAYRFCFLILMNRLRQRRPAELEIHDDAAVDNTDQALPEAMEVLHLGLAELGPPESEIVLARHLEELTFDELATRLGASPNTIKTRYYRGIQWLRNWLSRRDEETQ